MKEVHPAANIFPLMSDADLHSLAEDIKSNGLREPIALYQGRVLDGRNRLKACQAAGVEPRYEEVNINGGSPVQYVIAKNFKQRQLTAGQRAAAMLEAMLLPENRPNIKGAYTRNAMEKVLQVGHETFDAVAMLHKHSPEAFEEVRRGKISPHTALRNVLKKKAAGDLEVEFFPPPPLTPVKRNPMREGAAKRRMVDALSYLRGVTRGMAEFNIPILLNALSEEEAEAWATVTHEAIQVLQAFEKQIRRRP